ncbi:MAG: EVE domain-containing protein [Tepidisphaeraceae bacterium]|jgi:predicted RNA-binding protein with PUA-like domain
MGRWLLKTEPDCYCWDDLVRDKRTVWDGVSNALALKNLRQIKKGDQAFIYHTADQRSVIGVADVVSNPYPDPREQEEKLAVVDVKLNHKLPRPVSLAEMKADPAFAGWDLLRLSRLSVMSVPEKIWQRIEELARISE